MNIRCPSCQTVFRVDPSRIPAAGVRARCARCAATFHVSRDGTASAPTAAASATATGAPGATAARPAPSPSPVAPAPTAAPSTDTPTAPRGAEPVTAGPTATGSVGDDRASAAPGDAAPASAPANQSGTTGRVPPDTERSTGPHVSASGTAPAGSPRPLPTGGTPGSPVVGPPYSGQTRPAQSAPAPAQRGGAAATAPRPGVFGSRDPKARAQRIARALVSDIVAYHPDRRDACLAAGTLRTEFRDEIMKSWEEYTAQVGEQVAKSTPYFRNALNDILAKGQSIF